MLWWGTSRKEEAEGVGRHEDRQRQDRGGSRQGKEVLDGRNSVGTDVVPVRMLCDAK